MTLKNIMENSHKEIFGSRSKNRLSIQISYAIDLIIEFYPLDYLILMDYIEDVSVIENPEEPNKIYLYQIKTKKEGSNFDFAAIIRDEWFQKLYSNGLKYADYVESANLVCNADIIHGKKSILINEKTNIGSDIPDEKVTKIKNAVAEYNKMSVDDVDLSSYYIIKTELTTKNHKSDAAYKFETFLSNQSNDVQVVTARALYNIIYDKLDNAFNTEINEDCNNINEIFKNKGLSSKEIKDIINCGIAVQLPDKERLFSEFSISSLLEKNKYSNAYKKIKLDMLKDSKTHRNVINNICKCITEAVSSGIDDNAGVLEYVNKNLNIKSTLFDNDYINLLIMILILKYGEGDNFNEFNS